MPGSERLRGPAAIGVLFLLLASCWSDPVPERRDGFFDGDVQTGAFKLGRETRVAVPAPADGMLRRRLEVPPGAELDLAIGVACPKGEDCPDVYRFRLTAFEGGKRILFEKDARAGQGWLEAAADLAAFGGRHVDLLFEADPVAPEGEAASDAARGVALWGDPFLRAVIERPPPVVLFVSIDTLRADRLGCYGYPRPTSPVLDRLASEGVRFARAVSHSPWTTPSHLSMMTSLYPTTHAVNRTHRQLRRFLEGKGTYPSLPSEAVTLAETLRRRGYRTLALTGPGTMSAEFGLAKGFDVYVEGSRKLTGEQRSRIASWLATYGGGPLFLFFHTFEVHAPYVRHDFARHLLSDADREAIDDIRRGQPADAIPLLKAFLEERALYRAEVTSALYDGGIAYTDAFLGDVLEEIRRLGLERRAIVLVTSDHGEELADHDPNRFYDMHCSPLHEELIHVPLLLRVPGRFSPGTVVEEPVELVDVAPTLLDLLGVPIPSSMQGESLAPVVEGRRSREKPWTLSEATCVDPEWKALRIGRYKYVAAFEVGPTGDRWGGRLLRRRLFDLDADPRERRSLHRDDEARVTAMHERLVDVVTDLREDAPRSATMPNEGREELTESLRALGYVQ